MRGKTNEIKYTKQKQNKSKTKNMKLQEEINKSFIIRDTKI